MEIRLSGVYARIYNDIWEIPDKKTHLIYLEKNREDKAKEYSRNYKKLLEIVEEVIIVGMTLLRENACL